IIYVIQNLNGNGIILRGTERTFKILIIIIINPVFSLQYCIFVNNIQFASGSKLPEEYHVDIKRIKIYIMVILVFISIQVSVFSQLVITVVTGFRPVMTHPE